MELFFKPTRCPNQPSWHLRSAGAPETVSCARLQSAISKFVDSAVSLEPQLAWTYATTLTDPQKQKDALEKSAQQWLRVDDAAARAAIQASGLPVDTIATLLKPKD